MKTASNLIEAIVNPGRPGTYENDPVDGVVIDFAKKIGDDLDPDYHWINLALGALENSNLAKNYPSIREIVGKLNEIKKDMEENLVDSR